MQVMGQERTGTMKPRRTLGAERPGLRPAFTLIELLVVMTIIGIIIVFLLNAAWDGVRRAEERATQSLVAKLEGALNDRLDSLMQSQPTPNYAHGYLAGIYPGLGNDVDGLPIMLPSAILPTTFFPNPKCNTVQHAQVIATYDYIKAEMPDVFFVDPAFRTNPTGYSGAYPINFTGLPYPGTPLVPLGHYVLPLGHMINGPRNAVPNTSTSPAPWTTGFGDSHFDAVTGNLISTHPELGTNGTGINGASYSAAAGLYKNLGFAPAGFDMQDNDGNGLVDDWAEATSGGNAAQITASILNHTHNTARAEMLYALLVEGAGPLGSVFNRDDFTDKEVKDTDGDGLPEFVDAWGQPLQFFRWPILYHSDIQRGQVYMAGQVQISNGVEVVTPSTSLYSLYPPYATRTTLRAEHARAPRARPDRREPAAPVARLVGDQRGGSGVQRLVAVQRRRRNSRVSQHEPRGSVLWQLLPPADRAVPACRQRLRRAVRRGLGSLGHGPPRLLHQVPGTLGRPGPVARRFPLP